MSVTPAPPVVTKPYKAIVALVVSFVGSLVATLQGRTDLDTMKLLDWLVVIVTTAAATLGVYGTTNPAKST